MNRATKIYDEQVKGTAECADKFVIVRFIKKMKEKKITDEKLFSEADTSNDGVIDLMELNQCLANYGGFSEKELYSIMQFMDINGDF